MATAFGKVLGRDRATGRAPQLIDRLAVGNRDEPAAHVAVGSQPRVRLERGEKGLGPRVVGVRGTEQGAYDSHDDGAVLVHHRFERLGRCPGCGHVWLTPDPRRT